MKDNTIRREPIVAIPQPEFRIYSVKELAVLYYPTASAETASRSFRKLLRSDPLIYEGLAQRGFKRYARMLSPVQVRFLLDQLGSPQEFYESLKGLG